MVIKTCGECIEWRKTVSGHRKDDDEWDRVCPKGNRLVCKTMVADESCFETQRPEPPLNVEKKPPDTCGQCSEWLRTLHGRRKEDDKMARVCLKGKRLTYQNMQADEFCFTLSED